jgi:hypothetical protein
VTFTSLRDDSIGGDSNNDGDVTTPQPGDWNGIEATGPVAELRLSSTTIKYASACLSAGGSAATSFSGRVTDCTIGVASDGTFVDARDVDWGTPDGPQEGDVQGQGVLTVPWVGWVAPPRPAPAAPQPVPTGNSTSCKSYAAFGLRGSNEAPQGQRPSIFVPWTYPEFANAADGFGPLNEKVISAFEDIEGFAIKRIPIQYQALGVPVVTAGVSPGNYLDSIYDGVDKFIARILKESVDCPNEKFIIVGYSQGAMAAHIALRTITDSDVLDRIVGIAFIADPARVLNPQEEWWRSATYDGGASITVFTPGIIESISGGVWTGPTLMSAGAAGPLPSSIAAKTTSLCHNGDLVCASFPGASIGPHLAYSDSELKGLGALLAKKVPGGGPFSWTLTIRQ